MGRAPNTCVLGLGLRAVKSKKDTADDTNTKLEHSFFFFFFLLYFNWLHQLKPIRFRGLVYRLKTNARGKNMFISDVNNPSSYLYYHTQINGNEAWESYRCGRAGWGTAGRGGPGAAAAGCPGPQPQSSVWGDVPVESCRREKQKQTVTMTYFH